MIEMNRWILDASHFRTKPSSCQFSPDWLGNHHSLNQTGPFPNQDASSNTRMRLRKRLHRSTDNLGRFLLCGTAVLEGLNVAKAAKIENKSFTCSTTPSRKLECWSLEKKLELNMSRSRQYEANHGGAS